MIIVVTELQVRSFWRFFEFAGLSRSSLKQANRTPGVIHASMSNKGWRTGYTLTAWKDKESMHEFKTNGVHKKAMTKMRKLSTRYRTFIWESDTVPTMKEAKLRLTEIEYKVLK